MEKVGIQIVLAYQKEIKKLEAELNKLQAKQADNEVKSAKSISREKIKTMEQLQNKAVALNETKLSKQEKIRLAYEKRESTRWEKNLRLQEISQQKSDSKRIESASKLQQVAMQKQLENSKRFASEYAKTGGVADISTTPLGDGSIKSYKMDAMGNFEQKVKGVNGELVTYKGNVDKATGSMKIFSSQTAMVNKEVKQSQGYFSKLGSSLGHDILKVAEWSIATGAIYSSLHKIGEGITFIKDFDSAMAQVRMASGMTKAETDKLAYSYNGLAQELGISTKIIADSAVELYRQGLSTQEVNDRMADYIKLSKVAGETLQNTIEMGTAGTNAFGVSVKQLGDSASAVGDSVASSTLEIMQAIQKSGSSAQTAGVKLQELEAMAAVIGSTTRESGQIVGTSLKIGA